MTTNNFIGIQYNWRDGETYPLTTKLQKAVSSRIDVEDNHVMINYPDGQALSQGLLDDYFVCL